MNTDQKTFLATHFVKILTVLTVMIWPNVNTCQENIDLERGLTVYYNFDQNVLDQSGNENHGHIGGNLRYGEGCRGVKQTAGEFNGYNTYVTPGKVFDFANRSVSVWIYAYNIDGITPNNPNILCHDSNDLQFGQYRIQFNEGIFKMVAAGNSGHYDNGRIKANNWYHLVFTKEGQELKYYINGKLMHRSLAGIGGSTYDPIPVLVLGAGRSRIRQFFRGKIDEFRLYDRAINECEISTLYYGDSSQANLEPRNYFSMDMNEVVDSFDISVVGRKYGEIISSEDRFGNPIGAIFFNGNMAFVEIERIYDDPSQTIALWIRPNKSAVGSRDQLILKQNHLSLNYGAIEVRLINNYLQLYAGSEREKVIVQLLNPGEWIHLALLKDGNHSLYYLNGHLIGETNERYSIDRARSFPGLVLGGDASTLSSFFSGTLDDLRIYDRVLSQCEIDSLINEKQKPNEDQEPNDFDVILTPNPNNGRFEVKLIGVSYDLLERIRVYDILGRLIYDDSDFPASKDVLLETAASATYICVIQVAGRRFTIPFVKAD